MSPSAPVTRFNIELGDFIDNLINTLHSTTGIGLSAPQVGKMQKIAVMDLSDDKTAPEIYINPEIISQSGFAIANEACLSLPGVNAKVIRSAEITIKASDCNGIEFERKLEDMHAICMQHEIDHLHGILFTDRISAIRRLQFRSHLAQLRRRHTDDNLADA